MPDGSCDLQVKDAATSWAPSTERGLRHKHPNLVLLLLSNLISLIGQTQSETRGQGVTYAAYVGQPPGGSMKATGWTWRNKKSPATTLEHAGANLPLYAWAQETSH